jgi:hypothetical protein
MLQTSCSRGESDSGTLHHHPYPRPQDNGRPGRIPPPEASPIRPTQAHPAQGLVQAPPCAHDRY